VASLLQTLVVVVLGCNFLKPVAAVLLAVFWLVVILAAGCIICLPCFSLLCVLDWVDVFAALIGNVSVGLRDAATTGEANLVSVLLGCILAATIGTLVLEFSASGVTMVLFGCCACCG